MMAMRAPLLFVAFLVTLLHCNVAQQVQMPEAGALLLPEEELSAQVQSLQRNVSELWTYIYQLRGAVSQHLNHLRTHQVELEDQMHRMSHYHDGHGEETNAAHTDSHHHSGEQHSHSNEQHSHSGEHHSHGDQHSHSGEHSHSHGNDGHSHGSDDHSHGNDDHSHGNDDHSHGDDGHSHGSHGHYHDSHSHSHSHSHDDHGSHSSHEEGDGHHHHDHKDSHEKEDELQQTQQGADLQQVQTGGPVVEPLIPSSCVAQIFEYDLYEFAVCNVQPNRAIPEDQQQEIVGQVTLWQKKIGGSLNLHVRLRGFEMGDHHGHHQQQQQQTEDNETPVPVSHKHGFHIHSSGDLSDGCQSTGPHYNPKTSNHGGPNAWSGMHLLKEK
ncbi:sod_Cu domain-containing protein [Caerostris extrusa]|uniref:Sod_Cu domain-containing protein n=1 Tax=Caerostris extrusa TaxID=172846 RepID=A0AAV4QZR0_CAEEX|nr:sod_Cu domain-containing protein [Caerostris extrusa]